MQLKSFYLIITIFLWFGLTGQLCTKDIVYSRDYYTQPKSVSFEVDRQSLIEVLQKTLERNGYQILNIDEYKGRLTAGWRPVEADSHYAKLFERKDYGITDGAYYQLVIDLIEEGSKIRVSLSTTVKSIAGPLETTGKVEKKLITQLEDLLRPPQIEMTNVGVRKK